MANLKSIIKKLMGNQSDLHHSRAKCFSKDLYYNGPFDQSIMNVPLNQVVGSVGKCSTFDSNFMLRSHVPPDRLINIKKSMNKGKSLPPVNLYKINDEYYVMDGNHCVAAAKGLAHSQIMAKIVELIPSCNTCRIS
jgi:hypothetical protein